MHQYIDRHDKNNLTLWSAFCEVLRSIADLCIPVRQVIFNKKNTKAKHYPYSNSIQRAAARKCLLWRQSQIDPTDTIKKEVYKLSVHKYRLLALITRPPDGVVAARCASLRELRSFVIVRQVSPPPSSGRSLSIVRQVSLSGCFVLLSVSHAYVNDLDIDLARNTPCVDMSACQVWSRSAQPFGRPYGT